MGSHWIDYFDALRAIRRPTITRPRPRPYKRDDDFRLGAQQLFRRAPSGAVASTYATSVRKASSSATRVRRDARACCALWARFPLVSRSSFACRSSLGCDFAACDRSPRYTFTAALLLRAHAALRYQCDNSFGLMVDSQRDRLEELLSAEHCGGLRVRSGGDAVPVCLLHELLLINADEVACHGVPEAASGARAYLEREVYLSAGALQTCRITPVLRARPVPRAPGGYFVRTVRQIPS